MELMWNEEEIALPLSSCTMVQFYQDKFQKAFSLVKKGETSVNIGFRQANGSFCCNLKARIKTCSSNEQVVVQLKIRHGHITNQRNKKMHV
jgi:hypothetical protein